MLQKDADSRTAPPKLPLMVAVQNTASAAPPPRSHALLFNRSWAAAIVQANAVLSVQKALFYFQF
jgi:hypothetical protein